MKRESGPGLLAGLRRRRDGRPFAQRVLSPAETERDGMTLIRLAVFAATVVVALAVYIFWR
jgi:hypothetical protein